MQNNFRKVRDMMTNYDRPFYYEQSFMNVYFNLNGKMNYDIMGDVTSIMPKRLENGKIIYHFAGSGKTLDIKLQEMMQFLSIYNKRLLYERALTILAIICLVIILLFLWRFVKGYSQ